MNASVYRQEAVLLMSYEQQGVYLRLLSIAADNGSIPADVALIAQLLRLPTKRFAAKIWPAIAGCWQIDGERLAPRGVRVDESSQRPAESSPPPSTNPGRPEDVREADRLRQQRKRERDAGRDVTPVTRDNDRDVTPVTRDNDRDVTPVTRDIARSESPSVSLRVLSEAGPFSSERGTERGTEGANCSGEAEGPATIKARLLKTAYRSDMPPKQRDSELTRKSMRLHLEGMTVANLDDLVALDAAMAKVEGALLAIWIDRREWRAVLDEQRMKARQRLPPGSEEIQPLFAASVANELLRRQQTS